MPSAKRTRLEQFTIDRVKAIREEKGFSQSDLAVWLDTTRGFIGQVETPNHASKYNINHLNVLANELEVPLRSLIPEVNFPSELVKKRRRPVKNKKRRS